MELVNKATDLLMWEECWWRQHAGQKYILSSLPQAVAKNWKYNLPEEERIWHTCVGFDIRRLELYSRCQGHHLKGHDHLCLHLSLHITVLSLWTQTFHPDKNTKQTSSSMDQCKFLTKFRPWWQRYFSTGTWSNLLQDTQPIIWGGFDCIVFRCLLQGLKSREHFHLQKNMFKWLGQCWSILHGKQLQSEKSLLQSWCLH